MVIQAQIQALLVKRVKGTERKVGRIDGGGEATEVAKPQIFDGTSSRVSGFILVCKLYFRIKLREESVEGQIQWILS